MVAKILAGVALFFALTAIILKSVALSVPHFVDVHLVNDPEDANDGNRLGGVGVFQSEFNSDLEGAIADDIAAANIPVINIETPSLEFPLLFPSQENFFATVLPINRATLAELNVAVPGAEALLGDEVDAVNNLALNGDDCGTFAFQALTAVDDFFDALQADIIPGAVQTISDALPVQTFDALFEAIVAIPSTIVTIQQGASANVFGSAAAVGAAQANAACTGLTVSDALVIDAAGRNCLVTLFTIANSPPATPNPVLSFLIEHIGSLVACPDANALTVAGCIAANEDKYNVTDTNIVDTAVFVDNVAPRICDGTFLTCNTKEDFLRAISGFFGVIDPTNADLLAASGAIVTYVDLALDLSSDGTFAVGFDNWPQSVNPFIDEGANKDQGYQPCAAIAPLLPPGSCASLEQYLALLPGILETGGNPLAPTVASISGLYADFFEAVGGALTLASAPGAFAGGLIAAGFNTDFESTDAAGIIAEATQECADDVEDKEKIGQAQALAIASTLFEAVALLLIIVGIILPVEKLAYLAPAGAIAGILGGVFILTALFVVQSAPVYDGVGDTEVDPSGDAEVFFIQGYVPLLALVDAVLFFLSGVVLIAATVFACKEGGEAGDVEDIKADAPMEDKI